MLKSCSTSAIEKLLKFIGYAQLLLSLKILVIFNSSLFNNSSVMIRAGVDVSVGGREAFLNKVIHWFPSKAIRKWLIWLPTRRGPRQCHSSSFVFMSTNGMLAWSLVAGRETTLLTCLQTWKHSCRSAVLGA
jgi:hypothetical protein